MITGITHAVRYVPDYDQALDFYRDLLGMQVVTYTSMAHNKCAGSAWVQVSRAAWNWCCKFQATG